MCSSDLALLLIYKYFIFTAPIERAKVRTNVITRALAEAQDIYKEIVDDNSSLTKQVSILEEREAKNQKEVEKLMAHMNILRERNELMKKEATDREKVTRHVQTKLQACQEDNSKLQKVGRQYDNTLRMLLEKLE